MSSFNINYGTPLDNMKVLDLLDGKNVLLEKTGTKTPNPYVEVGQSIVGTLRLLSQRPQRTVLIQVTEDSSRFIRTSPIIKVSTENKNIIVETNGGYYTVKAL